MRFSAPAIVYGSPGADDHRIRAEGALELQRHGIDALAGIVGGNHYRQARQVRRHAVHKDETVPVEPEPLRVNRRVRYGVYDAVVVIDAEAERGEDRTRVCSQPRYWRPRRST